MCFCLKQRVERVLLSETEWLCFCLKQRVESVLLSETESGESVSVCEWGECVLLSES